ncbi:unnamed protein product [Leuciscus chuanchicus]
MSEHLQGPENSSDLRGLKDADQTETPDILHHCVQYFNEGHLYAVIMDMMSSLHGVNISLRTLKSKLNEAGLYRRKDYSSPNAVSNAIRSELRGPGQLFGYRTMWQVLKQKYNIRGKRDDVMNFLRDLNPRGCESRARRRSQFWMELFADLRDAGYFNGSHEHQCLLRYCFGDVIQKDLDECVRLWNSHRIRPSRTAACPGGVPNELYYLPHRFGSRDCGFQIEQAELDALPEASLSMTPCGDPNMQEYLDFAMEHNQLQKPENWESASERYMKLKEMAQL